jgi:hypothetical protein
LIEQQEQEEGNYDENFDSQLLALVGYVVLGITTLRAKALPLWGGLALILGFPLSVFLSAFGGGILFGLAWLGVGYFLLKK